MDFYEVICRDGKGRISRVSDDFGLQWFTTMEQAETIAANVANDPKKPFGIVSIEIYESKPVKKVAFPSQR
jgi:hypothetical protein